MESVTEVPEEASGLRQPRFWISVFLLLDRLPAKANEPCLLTHTLVDGTSMNEECVAVDAVGSMPKLQPWVDHQVCAVRFLT